MRPKHALFTAAGLGILLFVWFTREPSANGKSLSTWLSYGVAYETGPLPAPSQYEIDESLREIGEQAIPYLLERAQAKPPRWKVKLTHFYWKMRGSSGPFSDYPSEEVQHAEALYGFRVLSTQAVSAIPALTNLMANTNECGHVAACLAAIGAPAIPIFKSALTNGAGTLRARAMFASRENRAIAQATLPEFRMLHLDPNPRVAEAAVEHMIGVASTNEALLLTKAALRDSRDTQVDWALSRLEMKAGSASVFVAEMTNLLNHGVPAIRSRATNLLRRTDPATAQTFGINTNLNNVTSRRGRPLRVPQGQK